MPRFARPGMASRIGAENPSGPWMDSSSTHQSGSGRANSRPSGSGVTERHRATPVSSTDRVTGSPVRGQLAESPDHGAPAATHTTDGLS